MEKGVEPSAGEQLAGGPGTVALHQARTLCKLCGAGVVSFPVIIPQGQGAVPTLTPALASPGSQSWPPEPLVWGSLDLTGLCWVSYYLCQLSGFSLTSCGHRGGVQPGRQWDLVPAEEVSQPPVTWWAHCHPCPWEGEAGRSRRPSWLLRKSESAQAA